MRKIALNSIILAIPSTNRVSSLSPSQPMAASPTAPFLLPTKPTVAAGGIPFRTLCLSTKATPPQQEDAASTTPPPKKSFAVSTGEFFIGIASRLVKKGGKSVNGVGVENPTVEMFVEKEKQRDWCWRRLRKEGLTAVDDPVQPEIVWEQREEDVEAERRRKAFTSPGFSFSAAGLLFPYHLGVAQLLLEKGYIKETTPLAGSSAGAIVCATIASGASMEEALRATKKLADDCRLRGTAFRLGAVLREVLDQFLPHDVHIRSSGRVRVAVTQLLWRPRGLLVDQFDSRGDLIDAVITSSFIPGYLAPRPATMFRNRLCIDGGLTLFMPPTSAAQTVRVCAFPASMLGLEGIGISPDCNPENRGGPQELFSWALEPASDEMLDRFFQLGYQDAAVWAEKNPIEETVREVDEGAACLENGPAK
ncbi:uncharacterized protein LOC127252718 [Andrographis paniculata]|uniref:uncharacterized protein LOC127252718 n=1 Tax=Andrographis paniculata TaxID=175694 RepID=UPI0021E96387|nr:uncharacterized protein LOC127252718 [Andrographis paniculata]